MQKWECTHAWVTDCLSDRRLSDSRVRLGLELWLGLESVAQMSAYPQFFWTIVYYAY